MELKKQVAFDFCLYLTNEENQLKLAKLTNIIATNTNALNDKFYNDYSDLTAKSRSLSAKQIKHISPVFKPKANQKEVNILINTAVQTILLDKDTTANVLNKLVKTLQ